MRCTSLMVLALSAFATLASGCGHGGAGEPPLPGKRAGASGEVSITGAGATFPYPLYMKWIGEFTKDRAGVKVNYQSIGSGGGIRQVLDGTVDFGASDVPMSDEQLAKAPAILHIPTCLGAVVLAYNVEGVPGGLRISPEVAAGIFLGTVQRWDDPAITRDNPDAHLPGRRIIAIHRSDGSGTTKIFTSWLVAASPAWKSGPGSGMSVSFPSGIGAKGNEGVAGQVSTMPGAIGYVELVYAAQNELAVAAVRNASGRFVMPDGGSIAAAGAAAMAAMPDDLRGVAVDAPGPDVYPISAFSYLLVKARQPDPVRGKVLVELASWAVHEGQGFVEGLAYARLPGALVKRIDAKLAAVTGPDGRILLPGADPPASSGGPATAAERGGEAPRNGGNP
jgi:phosphate transport system substrate-binding protein